jgi:putative membrane protein
MPMSSKAYAAGIDGTAGAHDAAAVIVVWALALAWSGWHPYDRLTWFMEVLPVLIAAPLLIATRSTFPLTRLAYVLITAHGLILMLGGAYTYARVPAGLQFQEWLGLARNPYDRLGHFAQGFVPAIVTRELLIRYFRLPRGKLLAFLVVSICLAVSACYELIEWGAALALGQGADEFLGTQGDQWDTQWDLFMALVGAVAALALLNRRHDRQIARFDSRPCVE